MNKTVRRPAWRATGLAACAAGMARTGALAPLTARAQTIVMSGNLGDFEAFDNIAEPAHGLEIQMEDIWAADITQAINEVTASQLRPWTALPEVNQAPSVR